MKRFLLIAAMAAANFTANAQTLVMDVIDGHTDNWTTYKAGPWSLDLSTGSFQQLSTAANSWTIYGNCGAIHKGNYYWTFFGGESGSEDDPYNFDTEYGYAANKIVVRKWNDQTWAQVGDAVTYPENSGLSFTDLTYDANDDQVYAIILSISGSGDDAFSGYRFGTLDLETMTVNIISQKDLYTEVRAIAAHPNGNLYAVDYSGYLYTINKQTGELTQVGTNANRHKNQRRMQSMVVDWRTGKMYFAGYMNDGSDHSREGNRYGTAVYEVNIETGAFTQLFTFPNKEMVTGLYVQGDMQRHNNDLNVKLSLPSQMKADEDATITATVKNLGIKQARNYKVSLYVNWQLIETKNGTALNSDASHDIAFTFRPNAGMGNSVKVHALVEYASDQNTRNNKTQPVDVVVVQSTLPAVSLFGIHEGKSVSLAWNKPATSGSRTEDFEAYAPFITSGIGDWKTVDLSGKEATITMGSFEGTLTYPNAGSAFAWQVFNPKEAGLYPDSYEADTCTYYCQSGSQMLLAAVGAKRASNTSGYEYVAGNEWLISPELSGKAQTISFYAKCWTSQVAWYGEYNSYPEYFNVLYSTTDTDPAHFTSLTPDPVQAVQWFTDGAYTYNLPAGAKYFAIQRVSDPDEGFFLYIDDITYTPAAVHFLGYNVYKNGVKQNSSLLTKTEYTDPDGDNATYTVTAVYSEGESGASNVFSTVATGIQTVATRTQTSAATYNLAGQRVANPAQRGIYVRGGKKVLVK